MRGEGGRGVAGESIHLMVEEEEMNLSVSQGRDGLPGQEEREH